DDTQRLEQERDELQEKRTKTRAEAGVADEMRHATQERIEHNLGVLGGLRRDAETESEILNKQRAEAAAAAERRRSTNADLRRLENEREEVNARVTRYRLELTEASTRIDELTDSIDEIDRVAMRIDEEKNREEAQILDATARLERARAEADLLANELAELNRHAAASRDARAAIEVQRAEALARVNFVRESCANELNQSLEEIAGEITLEPDFDLDAQRAQVEDLRNRLENFGAVNMMALEE